MYLPFLTPLVFDNSLSYYEQLCVVSKKLNEIIDTVNSIDNSYIEDQISSLRSYVDAQDTKNLSLSKVYTDNETQQLEQQLEQLIYQQIQIVTNSMLQLDQNTRQWVTLQLEMFKSEIRNIPLPAVFNSLTGKLESVQSVFTSFYEYMRCEAISTGEYDNLFLMAQQFDDKDMNAREFDLYSDKILNVSALTVRSPFTGKFTSIEEVMNGLASLHQIGINASAFDNLDWTAQVFDNKQFTAYNFDWLTVA